MEPLARVEEDADAHAALRQEAAEQLRLLRAEGRL